MMARTIYIEKNIPNTDTQFNAPATDVVIGLTHNNMDYIMRNTNYMGNMEIIKKEKENIIDIIFKLNNFDKLKNCYNCNNMDSIGEYCEVSGCVNENKWEMKESLLND